jgi:hypothetical protein
MPSAYVTIRSPFLFSNVLSSGDEDYGNCQLPTNQFVQLRRERHYWNWLAMEFHWTAIKIYLLFCLVESVDELSQAQRIPSIKRGLNFPVVILKLLTELGQNGELRALTVSCDGAN